MTLACQLSPESRVRLKCRDAVAAAYGDRWKFVLVNLMDNETSSMECACFATLTPTDPVMHNQDETGAWMFYNRARVLNPDFPKPNFTKTYGISAP